VLDLLKYLIMNLALIDLKVEDRLDYLLREPTLVNERHREEGTCTATLL
jgi:hypothetical protein